MSSRDSSGRAFRPVFLLARRSFWSATPAARRRAPRDTPQHTRRAARCGCKAAHRADERRSAATSWDFAGPSVNALVRPDHTRGAWVGGGVPHGATVRRRACQWREGGGPGRRSREAPLSAWRRRRSEICRPAGNTRSRMTPAPTGAEGGAPPPTQAHESAPRCSIEPDRLPFMQPARPAGR